MDWQGFGKNWMEEDSAKLEGAFRESLKKLEAEGAANREIADQVIACPLTLGLVWAVTSTSSSKSLKSRYGRPPLNWEGWLAKTDLRDDWRSETVNLLHRKCVRDGMLGCKLNEPTIGGYWRLVIIDKAIKAAWKLFRANLCKVRHGKRSRDVLTVCEGDRITTPSVRKLRESLVD